MPFTVSKNTPWSIKGIPWLEVTKWLPNYLTCLCFVLPWLSTYCVTFAPDWCIIVGIYLEPLSVCFICLTRLLSCRWGSKQAWLERTLNLNKRSLVTLCFSPCAGRALMLWWPIDYMLPRVWKWLEGRKGERRLQSDEGSGEEEFIIIYCSQTRRTRGPQQYCQVGSLETKWKEKSVMTWLSYRTQCNVALWRPWLFRPWLNYT